MIAEIKKSQRPWVLFGWSLLLIALVGGLASADTCPPPMSIGNPSPGSGGTGTAVTVRGSGFAQEAEAHEVFVWDGATGVPLDVGAVSANPEALQTVVGAAASPTAGAIHAIRGRRVSFPDTVQRFENPAASYILRETSLLFGEAYASGGGFSVTSFDGSTFNSYLSGGKILLDLSDLFPCPPAEGITVRVVIKTGPDGGGGPVTGGGFGGDGSGEVCGDGRLEISYRATIEPVVYPGSGPGCDAWLKQLVKILREQLPLLTFTLTGRVIEISHPATIDIGYIQITIL